MKKVLICVFMALSATIGVAQADVFCTASSEQITVTRSGHDSHTACELALAACVARTDHHHYCSIH